MTRITGNAIVYISLLFMVTCLACFEVRDANPRDHATDRGCYGGLRLDFRPLQMVKLGWNGGNIASRSCQDNRPSGQFRIPGRLWRYNSVIGHQMGPAKSLGWQSDSSEVAPVVEDDPDIHVSGRPSARYQEES